MEPTIAPASVLLVDDETAIADVLTRSLRAHGFTVRTGWTQLEDSPATAAPARKAPTLMAMQQQRPSKRSIAKRPMMLRVLFSAKHR